MTTITDLKASLTGIGHGGTLNKIRNIEALFERAANTMLANIHPIETERIAALSNAVHDDVYNYTAPSDFKTIIDLLPQDNRDSLDTSKRRYPERFDARKLISNNEISLESNEGTKFIRINWRSKAPKTFHTMDSLTSNGTWTTVGSATGLAVDELFKVSGSKSIRFNVAASGDGLSNTGANALDLTDWDELADWFMWLYFPAVSALTSVTARWGNDVSSNYWESTAQTAQADGTAFKVGWNLIKFPWNTATETGTVAPATIDSFRFVIASTAAINNVRADNILVSLGRNFDIKYYSQYVFRNSSGTFLRQPASDDDNLVFEGTALQIYQLECLKAMAQQAEGEDAVADFEYARKELHGDAGAPDPIQRRGLYAKYRSEFPSAAKKATSVWSSPRNPNLRNR